MFFGIKPDSPLKLSSAFLNKKVGYSLIIQQYKFYNSILFIRYLLEDKSDSSKITFYKNINNKNIREFLELSVFESGNLALAIKKSNKEYNCLL